MVPSAAVQDIHTGPADSSSYAYGVNVHEVVVGNFLSQNEAHTNAFHWRPGVGMQLLLGLPGVTSSQAIAVNDQGVIVGGCTIAKNTYAVMWSGGPAVEMKTLWCPPPLKAPKVSAQPATPVGVLGQVPVDGGGFVRDPQGHWVHIDPPRPDPLPMVTSPAAFSALVQGETDRLNREVTTRKRHWWRWWRRRAR